MKVRKFTAATMPEAMQQIRTELGRNAVILQSKEIKKGGVLGFFQKKQIEVVAALDPDPIATPPENIRDSMANNRLNQTFDMRDDQTSHILAEIKQMKKMIHVKQTSETIPASLALDYVLPYTYLIEQEVDETVAEELLLHVQEELGERKTDHVNEIKHALEKGIEKQLEAAQREGFTFDKQVIHFIGPTGVGKTTTIAKIAAKAMFEHNKTVAFITTDTYRIAAIEQLKTYARILEVPIEVAYSKEDYMQALEKHAHADHIFVDTAGRNFRDDAYVEELTQLLHVDTDDYATMLVLSLSTKQSDMQAIIHQFRHMNNKRIIFTKLDETNHFGMMMNVVLQENMNIAYVTNGQDVPEDVIQPTAATIRSYVMSGYYDT